MPAKSIPAPGWKSTPRERPTETATAVRARYMNSVLAPMEPSRFTSPMPAMPETMEKKTSGVTIMRISRTKTSPIHLRPTACSPITSPRTVPRTRPSRIRFHRVTSSQ